MTFCERQRDRNGRKYPWFLELGRKREDSVEEFWVRVKEPCIIL